jgi:hypothetical protein
MYAALALLIVCSALAEVVQYTDRDGARTHQPSDLDGHETPVGPQLRRVLVIGGSGFMGRATVELLVQEVVALLHRCGASQMDAGASGHCDQSGRDSTRPRGACNSDQLRSDEQSHQFSSNPAGGALTAVLVCTPAVGSPVAYVPLVLS